MVKLIFLAGILAFTGCEMPPKEVRKQINECTANGLGFSTQSGLSRGTIVDVHCCRNTFGCDLSELNKKENK